MTNGSPSIPDRIRAVEWDEKKRLLILRERRIDFIEAAKILFDRVYEYQSDRKGETRFVAIGPLEDRTLVAVVYTIRGAKFRVITARRATSNEQRAYLHALAAPPDERAD
ncbi:MAG TPA: BrnT family toxin [Xanthobacteraceae bacterium]|jgi:uncharacterized protein|nr:BrnT family toxin [Xanthobacteraceae bacterium]